MFCNDTLWSNAKVAPECLKVWNPKVEGGILSDWRIDMWALRIWVSMTWKCGGRMDATRASVDEKGLEAKKGFQYPNRAKIRVL